jgi:peptidyl-tRNA hydrolase, PTH1 family
MMFVIVGLGNPGKEYAAHRHNVGFMAVDAIAQSHHFPSWQKKFSSLVTEGTIEGHKTLLMKPQTFMNDSGHALISLLNFFKIDASHVCVIYDELDLEPGKIRVKMGGGSGGHNGIKSIDQHCGKEYRRVRIGIGHPGRKELVHHHVLSDFTANDRIWLTPLLVLLQKKHRCCMHQI